MASLRCHVGGWYAALFKLIVSFPLFHLAMLQNSLEVFSYQAGKYFISQQKLLICSVYFWLNLSVNHLVRL